MPISLLEWRESEQRVRQRAHHLQPLLALDEVQVGAHLRVRRVPEKIAQGLDLLRVGAQVFGGKRMPEQVRVDVALIPAFVAAA